MCYQPQTLEDALLLMGVYTSTEAGIYLKNNLQKQAARAVHPKAAWKGDVRVHASPPSGDHKAISQEPPLEPPPLFNKPSPV